MRVSPCQPRAAAVLTAVFAGAVLAAPPAAAKSFRLGVAAAEVTRESAILWTRADASGDVTLRVSPSPSVTGGETFELEPERSNDRTVQAHIDDLVPGTPYYYRFRQGSKVSRTGRFTTAPPTNADATIRFAVSGDADAERARGEPEPFYNGVPGNNGLGAESFGVYRQMAAERNHFNVNLGDTIYSDSEVGGAPPARTVEAKWAKYRQNLALASLRDLRAATGIYNHWDDHEFVNDFTKAEDGSAIYGAGVTAFRDYMPAHITSRTGLYNRQRWGRNLDLFRLDERSFRSAKASADHTCDNPQTHEPDLAPTAPQSTRLLFATVVPSFSQPVSQACTDRIDDPRRTMLGKAQFERFTAAVERSTATFKVVVNEVPIQQFYALPYDRWEGYEFERKRVLHELAGSGVRNLVFVATDTHGNLLDAVRYTTLEAEGAKPSPYQEFVTGPVSTQTFEREIDGATGRPGNGNAVDFAFFSTPPPNGVGMPCSNINVYSYAEVQVTATALTITAKDVHGNVVRDQSDDTTPCVMTIPAQ